jgi:DNA helicase IV
MAAAGQLDRAPDFDGTPDQVLTAERAHLGRSREYLRLMREHVLSLPALAGDRVSQQYLMRDLHRRAESLRDLPDAPLFFGRLDYAGAAAVQDPAPQPEGERFHIGRRHVQDPDGRPVVIDWRAPVSRPFYRASQADPMGLARRRRFGFDSGKLTAFEDELFGAVGEAAEAGETGQEQVLSPIVRTEIERPRSGSMRDIVATIQPDQDDIVRAGADQSVCVQGAPGTGKTAVGLHRVAYLLYAYRERMTRGGVLVIGPNRAFLRYIRDVLPALGELDATQTSVAELLAAVPVRGTESAATARIKGDARMSVVLRRALWNRVAGRAQPDGAADERSREGGQAGIMLARGSRRWRVPGWRIDELVAELIERDVRYGTGREMLSHRIAHVILTQMEEAGETCDDRTHEAVRRTRQVTSAVDAIWPKADPARVVFEVLSDPGLLASAADGVLSPAEQAAIVWPRPPRSPGTARWSAADAVLVDEVAGLIERTASLAHIVVDEAQDLSPMACRAIGRRCATGSVTVLGDIAQGTTAWAAADWPQLLTHLGKPQAAMEILTTGYRVPRQILDFASRLLDSIAPGLEPAGSVRVDPGSLTVNGIDQASLGDALASACSRALARPGSVAVIAADEDVPDLSGLLERAGVQHAVLDGEAEDSRLLLVPVRLAKGLEFDHVIVVEPARIAAAEAKGLNRLYVALTRAVSALTVIHAQPLPAPLRG